MNTRIKWTAFTAFLFVAGTSIVAADPLGWLEKPVIHSWFEAGPKDRPLDFDSWIWADGSAEFKITPMAEFSEDMLPSVGLITVNGKEFGMAQRKDKNEKVCLVGSVPVGTFAYEVETYYDLKVYDAHGTLLVHDSAWWEATE